MATAAKWPTAAMSIADVYGELPNFPPLTLNGAINASVTSIVVNEAIPATWPTLSWLTIDNEIMRVTSYNAGTKTFTVAARDGSAGNAQSTTAASHASGAYAFVSLTAQQWNQVVAEVIALETQALGGIHNPNLVLNSDFSRRTVFGLAMPEVFADTSAWTSLIGALGTVGSNILTAGTASATWRDGWTGPNTMWRDGRWSATFKAVTVAGSYGVEKYVSTNVNMVAFQTGGTFGIRNNAQGAGTVVGAVANVLTLNQWYWLELECQGNTYIAKIYSTGSTSPGTTKASSTLLQTVTTTLAGADATAMASGGGISLLTLADVTTASQWGGIATGNGGVYVETWLPESTTIAFTGTLGGQAVGFNEAVDTGPIGKQWSLKRYIPATSRSITITQDQSAATGRIAPSTAYTLSCYVKNTSLGGSGVMTRMAFAEYNSTPTVGVTTNVDDAAETAWTRKTGTVTTAASAQGFKVTITDNPSSTRTGTVETLLYQVEQGSAATAWRGAESPAAPPLVWELSGGVAAGATTTSATLGEVDSRDYAANIFLPQDSNVVIEAVAVWTNSGANTGRIAVSVDGVNQNVIEDNWDAASVGGNQPVAYSIRKSLAAGKHRIALVFRTSAGTLTMNTSTGGWQTVLRIIAYAGK